VLLLLLPVLLPLAACPTFARRSASRRATSSSLSSLLCPERKEEEGAGSAVSPRGGAGRSAPEDAMVDAAEGGGEAVGGGCWGTPAGCLRPIEEKALEMALDTACVVALCTAEARPEAVLLLPVAVPLPLPPPLPLLPVWPSTLISPVTAVTALCAARDCSLSLAKPLRSARSLASCARISLRLASEMLGTAPPPAAAAAAEAATAGTGAALLSAPEQGAGRPCR
jgi:hypothetical protein